MKLIEAEHNEQGMLRSILFKTKDMAQNLMELSVNTHDISNFNTCDDYL